MVRAQRRGGAMIVLGLLGALSMNATQAERPSVLPPLPAPFGHADQPGSGTVDPSCVLAGVEPGKPIPKAMRRLPRDRQVRIIAPGDQVTMDLVPGRRNIHLDEQGNVVRITCG